jgi:phosphatidate phosphatase LPIN
MDGTLTKSDLRGLYNNYSEKNYLHDGYSDLIKTAAKNGYRIVWLTMRSLSLYNFSKNYIRSQTDVEGVLITEPEQFFSAVKKEVLKDTKDMKTNMLKEIKSLFPQEKNPFVGGLGNRDNDAIAYLTAGIPIKSIFLVDKQSMVSSFDSTVSTTYKAMSQNIEKFFSGVV